MCLAASDDRGLCVATGGKRGVLDRPSVRSHACLLARVSCVWAVGQRPRCSWWDWQGSPSSVPVRAFLGLGDCGDGTGDGTRDGMEVTAAPVGGAAASSTRPRVTRTSRLSSR